MTYNGKVYGKMGLANNETPKFNEVIATIELSEGDMMELQKILSESKSTWGTQLIIDIENAFARRDYLNVNY